MKAFYITLKILLTIASLTLSYVLCNIWYDLYVIKMYFVHTPKIFAILGGSIPGLIILCEFLLLKFLFKIKYSVFK